MLVRLRATRFGAIRPEHLARANARAARSGAVRSVFCFCSLAIALVSSACSNPLARQYEYEEQVYLSVDGRATVVVDASLPSLVALRGAAIDPSLNGSADRAGVRRLYESAGCAVDSVSRLWQRHDRRFVQIQVSGDLAALSKCPLLAWSTYSLKNEDQILKYRQTVGPPAGGNPGHVNWDGSELIAFKVHVPSRIRYHNVKRLDGSNGEYERGNILTWEQTLSDRLGGKPIAMEIDTDTASILYTTLWIFAGAFAAAVVLLVTIIWLVIRRGKKSAIAPRA